MYDTAPTVRVYGYTRARTQLRHEDAEGKLLGILGACECECDTKARGAYLSAKWQSTVLVAVCFGPARPGLGAGGGMYARFVLRKAEEYTNGFIAHTLHLLVVSLFIPWTRVGLVKRATEGGFEFDWLWRNSVHVRDSIFSKSISYFGLGLIVVNIPTVAGCVSGWDHLRMAKFLDVGSVVPVVAKPTTHYLCRASCCYHINCVRHVQSAARIISIGHVRLHINDS